MFVVQTEALLTEYEPCSTSFQVHSRIVPFISCNVGGSVGVAVLKDTYNVSASDAVIAGRELPVERRLLDGVCGQASGNVGMEFGRMQR